VATPPEAAPAGNVGTKMILKAIDPVLQHLTKVVVESGAKPGDPKNGVKQALADEMTRLWDAPEELARITEGNGAAPAPAAGGDDEDGPRLNA